MIRVNLIQKFALLNLFWLMAMGFYFSYWFSDQLIESVTRLHTIDLADELHLDISERFSIGFFDAVSDDAFTTRATQIGEQAASFLRSEVYPVQILWNDQKCVWSNQQEYWGTPLVRKDLMADTWQGGDRAKLMTSRSKLSLMWKSLFDEDEIINDASSYLRILLPISFPSEALVQSASHLQSASLVSRIRQAQPRQQVIAGVLELHKHPQAILERTTKSIRSVWKRVIVVSLLTYIALFSLFKSAFNTIESQSRELREQERLSNLGKMASYLAHEIRNPLFIIRGSAQTILEMCSGSDMTSKLAGYVIEEVDRMNSMVQDLLGLVKPQLAPSRKPTSVTQAITNSADRILKQAPKMNLVPQLDPENDLVWFNHGQLIQVFANLFRNARDACRGQGTILVESRATGEGNLQIRVTDDGPGIPEADLPNIFEPFFTKKENGTGLGLAIVRHLVTRNNATIDAVKPPGAGACFILTLRLAPESALEENPEEDSYAEEDLG